MSRAEWHISPAVVILLPVFLLFSSWKLLLALLLAALCHEAGHYMVMRAMHILVTDVCLTIFGVEMRYRGRRSYGQEILMLAAGPAANLLLTAVLARMGHTRNECYLLAGTQAILGAFNLLPIVPLDGGAILHAASSWVAGPYTAERICYITGIFFAAATVFFAVFLQREFGGGPFLILITSWLLWQVTRKKGL